MPASTGSETTIRCAAGASAARASWGTTISTATCASAPPRATGPGPARSSEGRGTCPDRGRRSALAFSSERLEPSDPFGGGRILRGEFDRERRRLAGRRRGTIQHLADLAGEGLGRERLLQEGDARFQDAVVDDGIVRVPGHEQDAHPAPLRRELLGQLAA